MLQVILIFFFRLFRFFWILMVMLKVQEIHSRCCVFLVYSIQAIVNLEDPVIRPCRTHLAQVREKPWDQCRHSLIANALSVGLRISLALPLQDCESQIFPVKRVEKIFYFHLVVRRANAGNMSSTKQLSSVGISVLIILPMKNVGKPRYVINYLCYHYSFLDTSLC